MSSVISNRKKASHHVENDVDVTPIMNMFVILIPFLVSMAVFTHYSVLNFGLPPNASVGGGGPKQKDLKLTVVMKKENLLFVLGDSVLQEQTYVPEELSEVTESALKEFKPSLKIKNQVILAINDDIEFDYIVDVMDVCRNQGFEKIALSEGPNNVDSENEKSKS